ncbi:MAG: ATP12 family chaperone protein [Methyloligellaceae bacterium]
MTGPPTGPPEGEGAPRSRYPGRPEPKQPLPKRFFKVARAERRGDGWLILLDDRPVRTPRKAELRLPTCDLAEAIVQEWSAQETVIDPATMPFTKLANTAIDRVRGREAEIVDEIVGFAGSDLLCYHADDPEELVALQAAVWDPVLAWMEERHGVRFKVGTGIVHVQQSEGSLLCIRELVGRLDAFHLTALHNMTTLTGSAILALAHAEGRLSADAAWAAAHVDEDWQISKWGEDAEATRRRERRRGEMMSSSKLLVLL